MRYSEITLMIEISQQFCGPAKALFPYYQDTTITDILINGTKSLYVEQEGKLIPLPPVFQKNSEVSDFVERLLYPIGKRVDALQPYIDGRLLDGARFHIILPPIAMDGPYISIRKHREPGSILLEDFGSESALNWLRQNLIRRTNILVCGGTGAGKTTLMGRLIEHVSPFERIALVEETAEINAIHPHIVRLECRPSTPEGVGAVSARTLIKNALRMRPDRIVLGECRGEEAFDLLQALNTGHSGSMGTLHANSCLDALKRLESLVLLTGYDLNYKTVRSWISTSINAVVFMEKRGKKRVICEIIEISGLEGEHYRFSPILCPPVALSLKREGCIG